MSTGKRAASGRMRIGVDLDGVAYQWSKTARYMLREILPNSPYTKDGPLGTESTHWDYISENVSRKHLNWLWKEGVELGLFRHGNMYTGTIKYVRLLAEMGDVIAITHRPQAAVHDTLAWLAYQKLPLSGVHILSGMQPKSTVMPRCNIYIDDKVENCNELVEETDGSVYLMDREWNQDGAPKVQPIDPSVTRVFGWRDFYERVKYKWATSQQTRRT